MTVNMKPYDPEHKGEFCTREGLKVTLWENRMRGTYPLAGVIHGEDFDDLNAWTEKGEFLEGCKEQNDLMCVILKREARVITLNDYGDFIGPLYWANTTFREVLPDDISQEKARAVIEAARAFLKAYNTGTFVVSGPCEDAIETLRAALGDDA